jgi:type I restriction enzyme, S subunit
MARGEDILDAGRLGEIRKRLGESLPEGWELTTLGETFKWGSGGTPKRTEPRHYGGDIPWLIIGDLNDGVVSESGTTITEEGLYESSAKWVEQGSVLLAMYGSIGKLGIAGRKLTTNQAIAFTKPDPVDAKYLFYYLLYTRGDLASLGKGATQKNISQTVIKAFPFVLAPQEQQKRIVSEIDKQFSRLDEAVANLKRVKANLKRYKAAVLKAAVEGRLVETEAELARREGRSYETGEQLLQRILETRRSQWKGKGKYKEPAAPDTTGLPELPEGWTWASLGALLVDIEAGRSFKCEERPPTKGETGVVKVSAVTWGEFDESESKTCLDKRLVNERLLVRSGDFLFSRANTIELVGACVIAKKVASNVMLSDKILRFRLVSGMEQWVLYNLRSTFGRAEIERLATGNQESMRNIGQDRIRAIRIPLPPPDECIRIVADIERCLSVAGETEGQIDANLKRAERLRQAILSRAFTGGLLGRANVASWAEQGVDHLDKVAEPDTGYGAAP